jgi:hypothetical protein
VRYAQGEGELGPHADTRDGNHDNLLCLTLVEAGRCLSLVDIIVRVKGLGIGLQMTDNDILGQCHATYEMSFNSAFGKGYLIRNIHGTKRLPPWPQDPDMLTPEDPKESLWIKTCGNTQLQSSRANIGGAIRISIGARRCEVLCP